MPHRVALLAEGVDRNSQLQTRKNAVTGLDFEVIPFGDEPLDKEIADFIEEQLNGIESFEDVENDLLDAIGKGFAVSEILWGYDEGHVVVQDIKTRHQKRFFWDTLDDSFKVRTKDVPEGILLPANKFIVHRYKARSGHTSRAGILRVVAWMYLFKNYDLKDWVSFAEIYGLPLRLGKYAPGASDSDKAALMRALIQIGSDAAGIIPDGMLIEFENAATGDPDAFMAMIDWCEKNQSKVILGGTLTSGADGKSSTNALGNVHNEVRHDLLVSDAKQLAGTLSRDLIYPMLALNGFSGLKRLPRFVFDTREAADLNTYAESLERLVRVGMPVPISWVQDKLAIPAPKDDEALLSLPQQSATPATMPVGLSRHVQMAALSQAAAVADEEDPAQQALDATSLPTQLGAAMQTLLEPVIAALSQGESPDSAMDVIAEQYPQLKSDELQQLLSQALFVADVWGRLNAAQ